MKIGSTRETSGINLVVDFAIVQNYNFWRLKYRGTSVAKVARNAE